MKEIWKKILAGVNLEHEDKPANESTCSCGERHNKDLKPISEFLDQVLDERPESPGTSSENDPPERSFPGCDVEGYSLDKR